MISNRGTEEVLSHYLGLFFDRNKVFPAVVMTDFDWAQINAINAVAVLRAPKGILVLLCWWHVLRAWKKHLPQAETDTVWPLLTSW